VLQFPGDPHGKGAPVWGARFPANNEQYAEITIQTNRPPHNW
jgi:hypothetical protein